LILITVTRAFDFGGGVGNIGDSGFDNVLRHLCLVLRFETFASGLDASNTASEEVRDLSRRFAEGGGSAASPSTRFKRRAGGIAPSILIHFPKVSIPWWLSN
jgi:hypothetical protein